MSRIIAGHRATRIVVIVLDYGGLAFEDDRPDTLAEAMAVLEKGLAKWFKEQGIEVEGRE